MQGIIKTAWVVGTTLAVAAQAADLEVTRWWTSGGEGAALAESAGAFDERT